MPTESPVQSPSAPAAVATHSLDLRARYPLRLGCTLIRHRMIGIHAVVNARAGQQHLNDQGIEEIEMWRDARAIRRRVSDRIVLHGFTSRFFRRHNARFAHLITEREEW